MCTLVLRLAPGEAWPLLVGANRDEMLDRPYDPPGPYWPGIVGGRDRLAGGTWLALNTAGVVAGVLNRPGSLGPEAGKRSRGDLPLLALRHARAAEAGAAIAAEDGSAWRSFNLIVADREAVFWLRGDGLPRIAAIPLSPGLHIVTAHDPDDPASPRIARHLPRFRAAPPPAPPDLGAWPRLLADDTGGPEEAMAIRPRHGFGTGSSALLGVSAERAVFHFAAGFPGEAPYRPVTMPS